MSMKTKTIFILSLLFALVFIKHADAKVYPIAIIGSGAAGTMAAKRATLNNRDTLLFTGDKKAMKSGRGHWVRTVDNIPSLAKYTRTINQLREETIQEISEGKFKDKLTTVRDKVISIIKENDIFLIKDLAGNSYQAEHVILATGIMEEQPHIGGTIKPILAFANKQLIAYCILCDGHRCLDKDTVVIGHSEAAAQNALVLHNRYNPPSLSIVLNGNASTIAAETAEKLAKANIAVHEEPIITIDGNGKERIFNGFQLDNNKYIPAQMAFVSLGLRPNNQFALALGAKVDAQGLVEADASGETSVENLYVIGDLRANSMKQIYAAWQHAVDTVQAIDRKIRKSM